MFGPTLTPIDFAVAGGGGPTFSPTDLTGLELWLDASDSSTVLNSISPDTPATDGQAIRRWVDKSGNDRHANQTTGANQPLLDSDGLNSKGVLTFDGINDFFESGTTSTYNFLHNGTNHIICAVVKFGTTSDPNTLYGLIGNNAAASNSTGIDIRYDDRAASGYNDNIFVNVRSGVAAIAVSNLSANGFFPANAFGILTILQDPDNATAADRSAIAKNGGTVQKNNTNTDSPAIGNASVPLQIGSVGSSVFDMSGQIAELIIVSGTDATEENRQQLLTYLNAKWAVY